MYEDVIIICKWKMDVFLFLVVFCINLPTPVAVLSSSPLLLLPPTLHHLKAYYLFDVYLLERQGSEIYLYLAKMKSYLAIFYYSK